MTAAEAIAGLAPIVGTGGVGAIIVAILGYKAQAAKGRPDTPPIAPATVSSTPFSAKDIELLANAVTQHHGAMMRIALILEWTHVEQRDRQEDFREFSERRQLQAEIAELRAQKGR